ncbi:MAG: TIGR03936 family radical SAM-associated protein, partial [Thermodesulfobacteriota bacterium]
AGTERLRKVINKEMDERVLFDGIAQLFEKGWRSLKLYFMIGLPTEKDEDLRGIVYLSKKISLLADRKKIHPNINVSVSTFVPKPHTPFQWASQIPLNEMKEKLQFLKEELKRNHLRFKWQDPHLSTLEGIFSKGDRTLSQILIEAHRLGCRFDGWSDQFHFNLWEEAFAKVGRNMDDSTRTKSFQENLPWSFIDTGIKPSFLWEEFQKGLRGEVSPSCLGEDCRRCGICDGKTLRLRENPLSSSTPIEGVKRREIKRKGLPKKKVRLRFKKAGESRFISHLELVSLLHRAAKRAGLPLCYSEGFHPMPRIIFATAISVGIESLSEIVDMELEGGIAPTEVMERLNQTLPPGIKIYEAVEVPLTFPSNHLIQRPVYWIPLDHLLSKEEVITRIRRALEKSEFKIYQERKGKRRTIDILPLIEKMEVKERGTDRKEGSNWGVELIFRTSQKRTAKPIEILEAVLGLERESLAQLKVIKVE